MNFEDWKKECKKLLYELDSEQTDKNIAYVDMFHYKHFYELGYTPQEANEEASLNNEM